MTRLRFFSLALAIASLSPLKAAIPAGYYDLLDAKKGTELRDAVAATAAGHTVVDYGDPTWEAFLSTDVITVRDRQAWRDMYSNMLVYTDQGHPGMNIEHSVANSWWGGIKNDAYKDLFHLNPSNSTANNQKSNYPLGWVADVYWTNGITTLGTAWSGFGSGANRVFEPADQFKGDFARAYFYIFTIYDRMMNDSGAIAWKDDYAWMYDVANPVALQEWASDMLLEWSANDPVDQTELDRNEAIYKIQGNRNPFIDYPELGQYIYGDRTSESFNLSSAAPATPVNRPEAPVLTGFDMTGLNTYADRWWDSFRIYPVAEDGTLQVSFDNLPWVNVTDDGVLVEAALSEGLNMTVRFRSVSETEGLVLTSPVTYLNLTSKNPENTDLKDAVWQLAFNFLENEKYIVVAPSVGAVMAADLNKTFFPVAGNVDIQGSYIKGVPEGTAVISGKDVSIADPDCEDLQNGSFGLVRVEDLSGGVKGFMAPTAAKTMKLNSEGVECHVINYIDSESGKYGTSVFDFGAAGTLQYNATSPRFLNYTSNQQPISIYRLTDLTEIPSSGVAETTIAPPTVRVEGRDIIVPSGTRVFDINGRAVSPSSLSPGIYIAAGRKLIVK